MIDLLTFAIFVMGILTVSISLLVAYKFYGYTKTTERDGRTLSSAISWQLLGEAVIGLGTLAFSAAAYYGVLDDWSIFVQSSLRFVMFFATSATTIHLLRTLQKLSN